MREGDRVGQIIKARSLKEINISPSTAREEALQNVAVILSTPELSVPLDREFGISGESLDKPIGVAQAMITAEIFEKVERLEPRVQVVEVTFESCDTPGKLIPCVEVEFVE